MADCPVAVGHSVTLSDGQCVRAVCQGSVSGQCVRAVCQGSVAEWLSSQTSEQKVPNSHESGYGFAAAGDSAGTGLTLSTLPSRFANP